MARGGLDHSLGHLDKHARTECHVREPPTTVTPVDLHGTLESGVGATLRATPLVQVGRLALANHAEHTVLNAEASERLTGLYIFNLHHVYRLSEGTDT